MKLKVKSLKYKIPCTTEAIVLFVRGTIKVQDVVKLYSFVSKNSIEEYIDHKFVVDNLTICFQLIGKEIIIKSANYIKANRYDFYFQPSLHFMARMVERSFDLGVLVHMYQYINKNIDSIENGSEIEISSESSIVFVKYDKTIKLVSGWPGYRYAS